MRKKAGIRAQSKGASSKPTDPDSSEFALVRALSHEILGSAAAIRAAMEVIAETESRSAQGTEIAVEIREQLDQMVRIVRQWLDFVSPVSIQSAHIPAQAVTEAAAAAGDVSGVETLVPPSANPAVRADPELLQRILTEMMSNAAAFGATRIEICFGSKGKMVTMQIRSNGRPLEPEDARRAFDPFFSTRRGRAGLGLSLVQKWMAAMDGRVEVLAERDGFELILPEGGE